MLKQLLQASPATNAATSGAPVLNKINYHDIAVIGMAVNFPFAGDPDAFWTFLRSGKDAIRRLPYGRLLDALRFLAYRQTPYDEQALRTGEAAFLEEIDKFDYEFFRLSPKEAALIDPNHRLFLQTAWAAIEEAGYGGERLRGTRTGVFVGSSSEAVYKNMIAAIDPSDLSMALTGNIHAVLPSRLAYLMDLRGPGMVVDTSCSSSLVAVHLACQSIRSGECDAAVAGGIQLHLLPIRSTRVGIESSNGRTRTFDDNSDGTGTGEGVGAVLLKPLHKALADGDQVHAVIKGSAINQDGKSMGLTAPNAAAQGEVILRAWKEAGIDPLRIGYIETHGTGTKLGDPIEIDGIRRAFAQVTDRKQFCAVGSVKSNLGHLDNAAGIAGLIKSILVLKNRELPPTLHVRRVNRNIPFEDSPVYINDRLQTWESDHPRVCGVSSFGISGTNCHLVLEEAPARKPGEAGTGEHIFTLSARSVAALRRGIHNYLAYLERYPDIGLADLCFTANAGRHHWEHRLAFVTGSRAELETRLRLAALNWDAGGKDGIYYGECRLDEASETKVQLAGRDRTDLERICVQYISGAAVDGNMRYKEGGAKKVSLPTYPFERRRCWLDVPDNGESMFYATRWEHRPLLSEALTLSGTTLLLHDCSASALALAEQIRVCGGRAIEARAGDRFELLGEHQYCIGAGEEDYGKLLRHITQGCRIDRIVYAMSLNPEAGSADSLIAARRSDLHSLIHLVKALDAEAPHQTLDFIVLSCYAHRTSEEQEHLHPLCTALFGLVKALHWEQPRLRCRCIDLDESTNPQRILEEFRASETEFTVAYRRDQRWVERLDSLEMDKLPAQATSIRSNGAYVITGGLGHLGLLMARYLASKDRVQLFLLNRAAFPPRSEWSALMERGGDCKASRQIRAIQEIEALGSNVHTIQADLFDSERLHEVLDDIRNRYGSIRGVMHCAGVGVGMTGVPVRQGAIADFDAVTAPKIAGTWNLARALQREKPDFVLLFSSTITLIGSVGSGSYTAANAYMDAFADCARRSGTNMTAINWPYWLLEEGRDEASGEEKELFCYLSPEVAFKLLDDLLDKQIGRVIAGRLNRRSRVLQLGDYLPIKLSEALLVSRSAADPVKAINIVAPVKRSRVKVRGADSNEISEVAQFVASVWHDVLGFEELGMDDNFFDIGGDSILVARVHAKIEERYSGRTTIADLFAYPTIAKIAAHLSKEEPPADAEDGNIRNGILQLVRRLEQGDMSVGQAVEQYQLLEEEV